MSDNNLTAIVNPTISMLPPYLSEDAKSHGESNIPLILTMMKYTTSNYLGFPGWSTPELQGTQRWPRFQEPCTDWLHFMGDHWESDIYFV